MDDQPRIVARAVQPYVAVTERAGGGPVDSLRRGGHGRELARRPSGTSRGRAPSG
jgi:hypothetical protein